MKEKMPPRRDFMSGTHCAVGQVRVQFFTISDGNIVFRPIHPKPGDGWRLD